MANNPNTISFGFEGSQENNQNTPGSAATDYIIARVSYVLLDDSDKDKFNKMGGWRAIGAVECRPFVNYNNPNADPIIAYPINSNITKFPVENEVVLVKASVSKQAQNNINNYKPEYYYFEIVSAWNQVEQNAVPDESFFKKNPDATTEKVTGKFISKGDTKRLVKAPGDITIEGRRGGSIRIGSNTPGFRTPWTAKNPNPVLIISNNPVKVSGPARYEDINKDGSSLFMISGHNVGFSAAHFNFDSYDTTIQEQTKQNILVVDQKPVSEPDKPLAETDKKEVTDTIPEKLPIKVPLPGSVDTNKEIDESQLPDREDLEFFEFDTGEVPVALGTAGIENVDSAISKDIEDSKSNTASTGGNPSFKEQIESLAKEFNINSKELLTFIRMESAGKYEKATLYRKDKNNTGEGKLYISSPKSGYNIAAVGLIQFTNPTLKCLGLNSLQQIVGTSSTFQISLMKKYFNCNAGVFRNADRYALYAGIFYPILARGGRIVKSDSFILGSEVSDARAVDIGKSNPIINNGNRITVAAFKRFVDRLFIKYQ
jgi:hypothetical protein